MRELVARDNEQVYGLEKFHLFHAHASVKKGWLAYIRNGRKFIPDRESVELVDDLWERDVLMLDRVYQWLTNDDPTYKAGEDLLAKRLQQERAEMQSKAEKGANR